MSQATQGSEFYLMGDPIPPITTSSAGHDAFYWMGEMNKASAVMLTETGVIARDLASVIARAVTRVIEDGAATNAERPGNYLLIERLLVKAGGPEVTRVHSGRSRQDMLATSQRLFLRDQFLDTFDSLLRWRGELLALAARHPYDLVPAYTHNVQAQPTTFGHYLGAFADALARNAERMQECWERLNRSPLGAAALGTSSFPIDRTRLAQLLGFDAAVENSFDANHVAPCDLSVDLAGIASAGALTGNMLINDVLGQSRQSRPWLILQEGSLTGTSTIMPQKRNPTVLVAARHLSSNVLGQAQACLFVAHNIGTGLLEHRGNEPLAALQSVAKFFDMMAAATTILKLDVSRAREEIDGDYSTTTELADILQRDAGVPFRAGHHYASELVNYGRAHQLKPGDIPYAQARRIYTETATAMKLGGTDLPLSESRFRQALSAENMINSSRGLGGPQREEVARMLEAAKRSRDKDERWLAEKRGQLSAASRALDAAFSAL
jgi:argininosuccinate lyase